MFSVKQFIFAASSIAVFNLTSLVAQAEAKPTRIKLPSGKEGPLLEMSIRVIDDEKGEIYMGSWQTLQVDAWLEKNLQAKWRRDDFKKTSESEAFAKAVAEAIAIMAPTEISGINLETTLTDTGIRSYPQFLDKNGKLVCTTEASEWNGESLPVSKLFEGMKLYAQKCFSQLARANSEETLNEEPKRVRTATPKGHGR